MCTKNGQGDKCDWVNVAVLNVKWELHLYGFSPALRSVLNFARPHRYSEAATLALCESVSVQSPEVILVVDFSSGRSTWDVACARQSGPEEAQRRTMLLCSLCCSSTSLSLSALQTHTHAHTLKSSLHTVGKTGVTDWMLPAEYFSATLLWRTQAHTYTYPHTHSHIPTHALC